MSKQVVVRTYPEGWISPTKALQNYLDKGYSVVCVNKITNQQSAECLEYILEIEAEYEEDKERNTCGF